MGLYETKKLLPNKNMAIRLKRHSTEWEKTFGSYASNMGLITRIYRQFKKLKSHQINDPMKKWAKEMNGAVFKGRSTNGKKKKNMKK
jgi:hypothetical protein